MCLRFVFLLITRAITWLRLSRCEEAWKTSEILILRHQLSVMQRGQQHRLKLNWADRALLATLLSVIPKARRQGLRLLVTPETVLFTGAGVALYVAAWLLIPADGQDQSAAAAWIAARGDRIR